MNFEDKYVKEAEAELEENKDKVVISTDAYAIGDMIDRLIKKIDQIGRFK